MTTGGQATEERVGPYRIVRRLGQGGMGVVHLAQTEQGRDVAVKVLRPHVAYDATARARLEREAATLRKVAHPGVAELIDFNLDTDPPYLVTRYVPGRPLDEYVEDRGPLTPQKWLVVAGCLAETLQAIHRVGVVHRDLKPGNVLLLDGRPVIIDFGIAQAADDLRLTATGLVVGTPGYLAPELADGDDVTAAADWWAWAATAAFAATGRRPFGRGPLEAVLHRVHTGQFDLVGVDPRVRPLLAAALSPDQRDRPSAAEILAGLDRYAEGRDALPGPVTAVIDNPSTRGLGNPPTRVLERPADEVDPIEVARLVPRVTPRWSDFQPVPAAARGVPSHPPEPAPRPAYQDNRPVKAAKPPAVGKRSLVVLSLATALVALATLQPGLSALVAVVLIVAARTVDRTSTALMRRRQTRGGRTASDAWAVFAATPVHLLVATLITALCLIFPLVTGSIVGVVTGFGAEESAATVGIAAGTFTGLATAWWGPGGSSLRRGTRTVLRGALRARWMSAVAAVILLGLAALCWSAVAGGAGYDPGPIERPSVHLPGGGDLPALPFDR